MWSTLPVAAPTASPTPTEGSWSWYLLGCASCSPSSVLVKPGLSGSIYIRSELRSLEPPMTRYPTWLPDAQGARRVVAGSMLSQGDVSFGDAPLLLNRRRRGTPVGETASRRWEYTTKLEARTVYSVFTRCALETCRAPRSRLLKAIFVGAGFIIANDGTAQRARAECIVAEWSIVAEGVGGIHESG